MRLFIDSANSADIREALSHGLASGITTNPSLIAKEPPHPQGYLGHLRDIARGLRIPISVQPPLDDLAASPRECVGRIAHVNATCILTAPQASAAMNAGARYVSFFWCRMRDAEAKFEPHNATNYMTCDFKALEAGVPSGYNGGGRAM